MSAPASPKRIAKKQSLSILSGSALNQINNLQNNDQVKSTKNRIISESTGLIKFSIKKLESKDKEEISDDKKNCQNDEINEETDVISDEAENFDKMPIFIPINCDKNSNTEDDTQEILFKMAAQQRKVLDLTEQLKQAKDELLRLQEQCKTSNVTSSIIEATNSSNIVPRSMIPKTTQVASTLRKSTSIMNLNPPKINAQEQILKTQKQVADTLSQITSNISNLNMNISNMNMSNNNFLLKSKSFFETNFNKNIQIGNELINSIFENDKEENTDDEDVSIEDDTPNFEYSVDFDLDRLTKMNISKKMKGTILEDLDEYDEEDDNKLVKKLSNISDESENDYGGDVTNL
ncbi:hypothetical protein C6P40_000842 [Pichia californica]|uniref:Uncharacterized protein n=1 Tax=Pichia californica TaxID=460514 RepID=A0A9P7BF42_9ASCO|nr:hypothetical protein C6P42_004190 [[Candida] californica]KAG0688546.1 hypothetical protein C6P40_000842 [[Candida] californica]